jgi:DNA polymerase-3 subunit delta'
LILVDMTLAGLADEIEKLVRRLQFPPFEGQVQLVLIDPADAFAAPTAQTAANRLLKTLEEPRPRTHFVLVTTAATALLSTIRSRCQRLRFAPLPDADLQQVLIEAHAVPSELAASVSKLAQGSLGRALQFVQDQDGLAKRQQAAQELYQAAKEGRVGAMVSVASDAGADREEAIETLDLLWLRLHEELMAAVARAGSGSGTRDPQVLRLLGAVQAVRDAQQAIRRYTSAPLSLERLQRQLHPSLLGAAHGPGSHR